MVVHQPGVATARRQTQVRVIDSQQKAMLRAGSEHPVRLEAALRNQIVDEHPDVRFIPPQLQTSAIAVPGGVSGVCARYKTLSGGLFISRGPVDLPGEEEPADALGLEPPRELGRLNEVVLDRVTGTK